LLFKLGPLVLRVDNSSRCSEDEVYTTVAHEMLFVVVGGGGEIGIGGVEEEEKEEKEEK
jgi:hypothetical protein